MDMMALSLILLSILTGFSFLGALWMLVVCLVDLLCGVMGGMGVIFHLESTFSGSYLLGFVSTRIAVSRKTPGYFWHGLALGSFLFCLSGYFWIHGDGFWMALPGAMGINFFGLALLQKHLRRQARERAAQFSPEP